MKLNLSLAFGILLFVTSSIHSRALNAVGNVFCDVNQNSLLDATDAPLPGVLVVVTNLSGTFSNANWTTTPDGRFVVPLPNGPDTYIAFVRPSTLPNDSSVVVPPSGAARFSVSNQVDNVSTNFLVNSPACRTNSYQAIGQVFCDINFNGMFDPIDRPLGVMVGITNLSGTFSNAAFSTNGTFILNLPQVMDTYVEFLIPSSLPPGFVIEQPAGGVFSFTLKPGSRTNFFSRFLIDSPFCRELGHLNETTGRVLCDANANGMIEADDSPLTGVMIVVTNSTGTFSNAVFTSASGTFVMALPAGAGTYTEFLNPATLPAGSTNLIPSSGVRFFIFGDAQSTNIGDFLIANPGCQTNIFEARGRVFCDANTNGFVDAADPALAGVIVVVTNRSGSFSNVAQVGPDGSFVMPLPHVPDVYDEFLLQTSLPANSTVIVPPGGIYCFGIGNGQSTSFGQFLVQSPFCQTLDPTNSWTKATSGAWEESVWSLGVLPANTHTIEITNAGFKAVGISSSTVMNFPSTLTIQHLDISAPTNSFNTLLENFAGTATPLHVLNGVTIGTNGRLFNLFSSLVVDAGGLALTNGIVDHEGGYVGVGDVIRVGGFYNLTNALVQSPRLEVGTMPGGTFNQKGGTGIFGDIVVGPFQIPVATNATYHLVEGSLISSNLMVGGGNGTARFLQNSGTNTTGDLAVEGFSSVARYDLAGGLLGANTEEIFSGTAGFGAINQSGGRNVVTNDLRLLGSLRTGVELHQAIYNLSGGTLSAKNLLLEEYSSFAQSNGTTYISATLHFAAFSPFLRTTSFLTGGLLAAANVDFLGAGENLTQTGGRLIVTNLFSFGGWAFSPPLGLATYDFAGGTLTASNIEVLGNMIIGSAAGQTRRITNGGFFRLGGGGAPDMPILTTAAIDEQLGRLILARSATIDMGGGASRLAFANSSAETWGGGAVLSIVNWTGSTNGGGSDRLFVGTTAAGLSSGQLAQIHFVNPAGLPGGTYQARILATGEVVPIPRPALSFSRTGNMLVLSWQGSAVLQAATNVVGPYIDITNAVSPTTNIIGSEFQRYFRLRQ